MNEKQILVIGNGKNVCESVKELLKTEHKLIVADSTKEGLVKFFTKKPDLVILDIDRTGIDGMEILSCIKKLGYYLPVIIVSGTRNLEIMKKSFHFDTYCLNKPLNMESLIDKSVKTVMKNNYCLSPAKKYFSQQLNLLKNYFYANRLFG